MEQYRTCPACKIEKPADQFFKNKANKNGLSCYCKPCHQFKMYGPPKGRYRVDPEVKKQRRREYQKKWQAANPDKMKKYQSNYYWNHRESELAKNKIYREQNSDKERNRKKRYAEKNPDYRRQMNDNRRSKLAKVPSEKFTAQDVLNVYGSDCHICGQPIDLQAPRQAGKPGWQLGLHLDHVISLADGGGNILANVKPAHAICNLRKH